MEPEKTAQVARSRPAGETLRGLPREGLGDSPSVGLGLVAAGLHLYAGEAHWLHPGHVSGHQRGG